MNGSKNRVLIVIDAFTKGGAQKVLLQLVPCWISQGFSICLVLIQNSTDELDLDSLQKLGVAIHRLNSKKILSIKSLLKALSLARGHKPDVIQCHLYWAQLWGTALKMATPKSNLVWVEHNTYHQRTRLQWRFFKFFSFFSTEVITVSNEVFEYLRHMKIRNLRIVPNPVSERYSLQNFGERQPIFSFVGRLNAQKNPLLALQSFHLALEKTLIPHRSHLQIIGDGPMMMELQEYVTNHCLQHAVSFKGFLDEGALSHALNESKVLLSTSNYEGFALVRLEAFLCGAAVVTTKTGGIAGILTRDTVGFDPYEGVFIADSNVESLSVALSYALSSYKPSSERFRALESYASQFQAEHIAAKYFNNL